MSRILYGNEMLPVKNLLKLKYLVMDVKHN